MAKAVRNNVAACRLTDEQWQSISDKLKANRVAGAPSPGLLARKLLLDWDDGELRYRTREREQKTKELWLADQVLSKTGRNGAPKAKKAAKAKAAAPAPSAG